MADLSNVPANKREGLMEQLLDEVADMSSRELVFLLLDAMDEDELKERYASVSADGTVVH